MARYVLSKQAKADLLKIAKFTERTWGTAQAKRYIRELEGCCDLLAGNPYLGRPAGLKRADVRRIEQGKHVVFYLLRDEGVWVSRFLHQEMKIELHRI